ncbi:L-threonine dehydratase catabolic TdcB [Biomphalaria pfeifferi]|uniref:Serine racemase n=1 Tax=Biomphalaria pfeifferi TaxID=112525 RepID=A0AAD8CAV0_BIOPF|nr:L-threonine dehydratase catabolic TdcB [Biomphalaria pfeifferi]
MGDFCTDDPFCDPEHPKLVSYDSVQAAKNRLQGEVCRTRCKKSETLSEQNKMNIYLKMEIEQNTGSFKDRGAFNAIKAELMVNSKVKGVISASAGNHAMALAYAGQKLGVHVIVVMPTSAPKAKIEACERCHAEVRLHGKHIGEAKILGLKLARKKGYTYINGYDHPEIISGQATVATEIFEDVKHVDAIVVPTGGGGLIAGVAVVAATERPHCKVIGVESEASTGFQQALDKGHPVDTPLLGTLAHGLAVPKAGVNSLVTAKSNVHKMLTVREPSLVKGILKLFEGDKIVAEGAGAVGVAALMEGLLSEYKGKTVVIIVSGGNIDTTQVGDILERALVLERRLLKFDITVTDLSSGLSTLGEVVQKTLCNLKKIEQEIQWHSDRNFSIVMKCVVETKNCQHSNEFMKAIAEHFTSSSFHC